MCCWEDWLHTQQSCVSAPAFCQVMEMNCSHLRMGTQISFQAGCGVRNRSTMAEGRMDNVKVRLVKPPEWVSL